MSKKYIALTAIQTGTLDQRIHIEPKSSEHSGLFEADFDEAEEKRLIDSQVIRLADKTESLLDLSPFEVLEDSREDTVTAPKRAVRKPKAEGDPLNGIE